MTITRSKVSRALVASSVLVSDAVYKANYNDVISADTQSISITIELPQSKENTTISVFDYRGSAETNNIIIQALSGDNIEGDSSYTISTNWGSVYLMADSDGWKIVNKSAAQLDLSGDGIVTSSSGTPVVITGTNQLAGFNSLGAGTTVSVSSDLSISSNTLSLSNAGGDVTGSYSSLQLDKIQGNTILASGANAPSLGQSLAWDGNYWKPTTISTGGGGGGLSSGFIYYFNDTSGDSPLPAGSSPAWKEMSLVFLNSDALIGPTSITSTDTVVGRFITELNNPSLTTIPPGFWEFTINASSANNTTQLKASLYSWDGTSLSSLIGSSAYVTLSGGSSTSSYVLSIDIPVTSISSTDRLAIVLEAKNTVASTVTISVGPSNSSYVKSTISVPGGIGIAKVFNGIYQVPVTLIDNADINPSANIDGSKIASATSSNYGVVKVTNDLGGSADSPQVVGIYDKPIETSPSLTGQGLFYNSSGNGGGGSWVNSFVSNANVDNSANISGSKIAPATSSNYGVIKIAGDLNGGNAASPQVVGIYGYPISSSPTDHKTLIYNSGSWTPSLISNDNISSSAAISGNKIASASSGGVLGVISLSGDLGNIASSPQVVGIRGKSISSTTPTTGQALIYNSAGSGSWEPGNVAVSVDPATSSSLGTIQLAGDLNGGSATSPQVVGIRGKSVTSTPGTNEYLKYNGTSWVTDSGNAGPTGPAGPPGPAPSGTGVVVVNSGVASTLTGTSQLAGYNGSSVPSTITTSLPLAISGTNLKITDGTTYGQFLFWNGTSWIAQESPSSYSSIVNTTSTSVNITTESIINYTGSGNATFTLPNVTSLPLAGRKYIIKNSGTGTIVVNPFNTSQTIDGAISLSILVRYASYTLVNTTNDSSGVWIII